MKKKIRYHLAMILLHASKPFTCIGNALYMAHTKVLRWNREE